MTLSNKEKYLIEEVGVAKPKTTARSSIVKTTLEVAFIITTIINLEVFF